jgi:hypothetical protein
MLSFVVSVVAVILACLAWQAALGMAANLNALQIRLDRLERKKGIVTSIHFLAEVKMAGKRAPVTLRIKASSEGDAVRQLLEKKIDPKDVISLKMETED